MLISSWVVKSFVQEVPMLDKCHCELETASDINGIVEFSLNGGYSVSSANLTNLSLKSSLNGMEVQGIYYITEARIWFNLKSSLFPMPC